LQPQAPRLAMQPTKAIGALRGRTAPPEALEVDDDEDPSCSAARASAEVTKSARFKILQSIVSERCSLAPVAEAEARTRGG
jgi:hypothetical protein